jgi:hypothetical protein
MMRVKQVAGSIVIGILITCLPLVSAYLFPSATLWRSVAAFCDWPMVLVQRYSGLLTHRRELDRLVVFFLINVLSWAVIADLISLGVKKKLAG